MKKLYTKKIMGFSLIEMVLAISILTLITITFFKALTLMSGQSVEPIQQKQGFLITQSLMDEIYSKSFIKSTDGFIGPFTDANRAKFDAIDDYNGYSKLGVTDINAQAITGLENYQIDIVVNNITLNSKAAKEIIINITTPRSEKFQLKGYKINDES